MRVEAFPEIVDGGTSRLGSDVEENADIGFDERPKGIEEPAMGIKLLLVLFFEAEEDLNGACTSGDFSCVRDDDLGSILKDVSGDVLAVDRVFGNTLLIAPHQVDHFECTLIDFVSPIGDNANNDLFPAIGAPSLRPSSRAKECYVLDNCVHSANKKDLIFVVHRKDDEELSLASI